MEVVFLGTTAAIPTTKRAHTAIALRYEGEVILWDCGEGVQRRLIKSGISYMRISKIFVTHLHGDHFLGLPGLIQTLSFAGRSEALEIYGPPGIEELVRRILKLGYFDLNYEVKVGELSAGFSLEERKYTISALPVEHGLPAFGLVFEEKKGRKFLREKAEALGIPPGPLYKKLQRGESVEFKGRVVSPEEVLGEQKKGFKVVYSGDTRPTRSVERACRDALLIHDSTFDHTLEEEAKERLHSTCVEAAQLAKRGNARMLYLTHISPRYKDAKLLEEQAKKIFPESYVAEDFASIDLQKLKKERGWWD
jgi:ribonuclease Z